MRMRSLLAAAAAMLFIALKVAPPVDGQC